MPPPFPFPRLRICPRDWSRARPGTGTDPEKCGWKSIANVDTRPKEGEVGGQYGVSIADSDGALGKYRYLLFDVSPTETDDGFGNTFFSEIDVVDGVQLIRLQAHKRKEGVHV